MKNTRQASYLDVNQNSNRSIDDNGVPVKENKLKLDENAGRARRA